MNIFKKWFIAGIVICVSMIGGIGGKIPAYATIIDIDYPPEQGSSSQSIAANVPAQGNVWTGVAQSFLAKDTNILFGFYMTVYNTNEDSVLFSLYSGDGMFSNLLGQQTVKIEAGSTDGRDVFAEADFSSIKLTQGSSYTVVVSLTSQTLPLINTSSNISIKYASSSTLLNPYPEGRFYFIGSSYDMNGTAFSTRDIAFKISPSLPKSNSIVLNDTAPDTTITTGTTATVYGSSGANHVTIESGANVKLVNFPGSNIITIKSDSSNFTVSRSGATVTFQGSDGTVLKIPATKTVQKIYYNDVSKELVISNNKVMLGSQEITVDSDFIRPRLFINENNQVSGFAGKSIEAKITVLSDGQDNQFSFSIADAPAGMAVNSEGVITYQIPAESQSETLIPFKVKVINAASNESLTLSGSIYVMKATEIASSTVTAQGGTVTAEAEGVSVDIPAGAVSQDVKVKIIQSQDISGNSVIDFAIDGIINGTFNVHLPDPDSFANSSADRRRKLERHSLRGSSSYPMIHPWIKFYEYDNYYSKKYVARLPNDTYDFSLTQQELNDIGGFAMLSSYELYSNKPLPTGSEILEGEPVLFIHGYADDILLLVTLSTFGGGETTWSNFPMLIDGMKDVNGLGTYIPFEFRWNTNARFEDAADDLGKCLYMIASKTNKKVHIIAHSYGGILARTLLQNLNANKHDYSSYVASATMLGSPHSGIFDKNTTLHGMNFPAGQDTQCASANFCDMFEAADHISAYQMGEPIGYLSRLHTIFQVNEKAGKLVADLAMTVTNLPANLPVQIGIGLTTYRGSDGKLDTMSRYIDIGDKFITYEGQRFLPELTDTSTNPTTYKPLLNNDTSYGGKITEFILGFNRDVHPGDYNDEGIQGYQHSSGTDKYPSEAKVLCANNFTCDHPSYKAVEKWLTTYRQTEPQNFLAPNNVTASADNGQVTLQWDSMDGIDSYYVYYATSPNIDPLRPDTYISSIETSEITANITGLTNGGKYYFGVAVITPTGDINLSNIVYATPRIQPDIIDLEMQPNTGGASATVQNISNPDTSFTHWFSVRVPTGATNFVIITENGSGNADLSVIPHSNMNLPADYDCISEKMGNQEECRYDSPPPGDYNIIISGEFNQLTLRVSWEEGNIVNPVTPPQNLTAQSGNGSVTLQWDPVDGNYGYTVYCGTNPNIDPYNPATYIQQLTVDDPSATIDGLTNGVSYYFGVTTITGAEASDISSIVSATPNNENTTGDTFTNTLGMTFNLIPAGTFTMGSPSDELGRSSGETQHQVTLTNDYYMQTTEVTQGQWKAVMGSTNNPSYFSSCGDNCPVEKVSWDDIQTFITKLNAMGQGTYALPTEAQWEYAARAGSTTAFANGAITETGGGYDANLDAIGWYYYNAGSKTHSVAQKSPNNWGLYDMHGNVLEWINDWYASYPTVAVTDPVGPGSGSYRVIRGGSWLGRAINCRSALRGGSDPAVRNNGIGFRVVCPQGHQ